MFKRHLKPHRRPSDLLLRRLEDRILFDAAPGVAIDVPEDVLLQNASVSQSPQQSYEAQQQTTRHEIVFVDKSVDGYESLVEDILHQGDALSQLELVLLDANENGVEQISQTLRQHSDVDAIHIISHGDDQAFRLGNVWVNGDSLGMLAPQITSWRNALAENADLLIYGCNLAGSVAGQTLVQGLSELAGADVAASVNDTGHASLGGDWDLEYTAGAVESSIVLSADAQASFVGLLAVGPDVQIDLPAAQMIGEDFSFTVTFQNTGNPGEVGYGPFVDLMFPVNGADGAAGTDAADGIDFVGASYLGAAVTAVELVFPDDGGGTGTVDHPYAVDNTGTPLQVSGTTGDKLVVLQLPFGSFTPEQPDAVITVNATLSNLADLATPLAVTSRGGFQYGADPLNNPSIDPSILSDIQSDSSAWVEAASCTPTLMALEKTYVGPENETATGPNHVRQYRLEIDVADGQTITDLDILDELPNNIVVTSVDTITPAGSVASPVGFPYGPVNPLAGNELAVTFPSVTGGPGSADAQVVFSFYVSEFDADGNRVIPLSGEDDTTSLPDSRSHNNARAVGDWNPIDTRDAAGTDNAVADPDPINPEHTLDDKSIAVQKSVAVAVGGPEASPDDVLEYTLSFQISDYYTFGDLLVTDTFQDGQLFDFGFGATFSISDLNGNVAGNFTVRRSTDPDSGETLVVDETLVDLADNAAEDPATDGSTTLTFDISNVLIDNGAADGILQGGLSDGPVNRGAATGTISFRTIVQDEFADTFPSGDRSVDQGDLITNSDMTVSGTVRQNAEDGSIANMIGPAPDGRERDGSSASVTIATGSLTKDIYAVNGNTVLPIGPSGLVTVSPGDIVTYRLRYDLPSSDFEDLRLTDYVPLPVFDMSDPDGDNHAGPNWTFNLAKSFDTLAPVAGQVEFGPNDTFHGSQPGVSDTSNPPDFFSPPQLTIDPAANSIELNYGDYDDPAHQSTSIELLFSVTAQDDPFADGLFLTNIVRVEEGTTGLDTRAVDEIVQVELAEPEINVSKGAVATTSADGTFAPATAGPVAFEQPGSTNPAFVSQIDSPNLAATPIDSNLDNIDASDLVKFAIVLENVGNADAYDLVISDAMPAGFQIPANATGLNLEIRDGNGNLLQWRGVDTGNDSDLFGGGVAIYDPIRVYLASDATDELTVMLSRDDFDPVTNEQTVGPLGVPDIEAMARNPLTGTLYAADADTLGTINLATGAFTAVGGTFGTGSGPLGNVTFSDVDGLAFNPMTGELYGVHLEGVQNVIFKIDTTTGSFVNNAFGADDYIALNIAARIDDIAIDKAGTMFGTDAANLIRIDLDESNATSALTTLGAHGSGITDMEGLSADDDGRLWGTTGNTSGPINQLWEVDKTTGVASSPRQLDNGGDYAASEAYFPGAPGAINDLSDAQAAGDGSNIVVLTFDLEATIAVQPNQTYTNTGSLSNYSGSDSGSDFTQTDLTDAATIGIDIPVLAKSLLGTEVVSANNANNQAAIGEIVNYQIVVDIPEGTASNFQVTDLLDAGLAFMDGDANSIVDATIVVSPGLSTSVGTFTDVVNTSTVTSSGAGPENQGRRVTFDFGTVTNTNTDDATVEQITITYDAIVINASSNGAGGVRNNSATLSWSDGSLNSAASNVTIIEPLVTVQKTASVSTADVGDTVTFTVVVANQNGANRTDAWNVTLQDVIPAEFTFVPGTLAHDLGVAPDVGTLQESAGSISATWSTLGLGQSSTVSFDVTVNSSFVPPGRTNTADIEWTSLAGAQTVARSSFNTLSVERTGDPTDPAQNAADNDYNASNSATVNFPIVPTKTITATSEAHTSDVTADTAVDPRPVAIGEIVSYHLRAQVGEGTLTGVTFRDSLTDGMMLLPGTVMFEIVADNAMTVAGDLSGANAGPIALPAGRISVTPGATQQIDFSLGNIINNDNDADAEYLDITFDALTSNVVANNDGVQKANSFQLIENAVVRVTSNDVVTEIVEPAIADVDKRAINVNATGDQVTYRVTFSNTGSTTAFDLQLLDNLPAELSLQIPGISVTAPGVVDTTNSTAATLDVRIDQLAAGASVTVDYTVDVTFAGTAIQNDAKVTYTGLPGTNGTASATPGAPGADDGERIGLPADPVDDYIDTDSTFLGSIGDRLWYDMDSDGVQDVGEPGIPGATVNLTWFGPNGVLGGGDDVTMTTTTDASGNFEFAALPPGNYTVTVDALSLPNGLNQPTFDLNGTGTPHTTATSLADSLAGVQRADVDFGYTGSASIGDSVWFDYDAGATQNNGEPGILGVDIALTWEGFLPGFADGDEITYTRTTDASGAYDFTSLPSGQFLVDVDPSSVDFNQDTLADTVVLTTGNDPKTRVGTTSVTQSAIR